MKILLLFLVAGCSLQINYKDVPKFKKCVSEQIQVARENWDTKLPSTRDDAEFVAQDELTDFITEICFKEN